MVVVSFTGLVVLEPIEDVLVLNLAKGTEVGGDLLNLLSAWCSQPRAKEIRQHLHLLSRRIPPSALSSHSAVAQPGLLHLIPGTTPLLKYNYISLAQSLQNSLNLSLFLVTFYFCSSFSSISSSLRKSVLTLF